MTEQIDLQKIFTTAKRNFGWSCLIIAVSVFFMFVYLTFVAHPSYQKSTQIIVNQYESKTRNGIEAQSVQADLQLVNTYSTIVMSPRILGEVNKKLGMQYSTQALANMIQVKNTTNSQIIEISVESSKPKQAAQIANLVAATFVKETPKIMKIDNVKVLSNAEYTGDESPVKPRKALMLVLAFFLGLFLAFGFIVIKLFADRTFTSAEEIEELLEVHVLGEVSEISAQADNFIQTRKESGE
ncbi:capsular polysaccharide biosynthesis protein [Listeria floridensis FSL S10-1187]|uniref:Capsular polysaccharide biosynthesis protein n=1 Tax=Listeria floridensis FSL S10-1187 TaxID=1265817 RepID=A0ABP3AZ76_9LIST|nr:Wzz/FepE/Etk N-terminal domain-containing protein [Listeria floridensis]EUJ31341.1 capsular polysaccharide biosynthesis protein [Listeria floridensis FSL S10-1187]